MTEHDMGAVEVPSGTVMFFYQDEPPAGWEVVRDGEAVPHAIVCRKL